MKRKTRKKEERPDFAEESRFDEKGNSVPTLRLSSYSPYLTE
jgi:hypothetical protein